MEELKIDNEYLKKNYNVSQHINKKLFNSGVCCYLYDLASEPIITNNISTKIIAKTLNNIFSKISINKEYPKIIYYENNKSHKDKDSKNYE